MRKIALFALVSLLAACSSSPKDSYDRRIAEERQRRDTAIDRAISQAPKWMSELPTSANAVFANGSAASADLGMADNKAKLMAYGKICMAAGGRVDQRSRVFMQDYGDANLENSELAIRSICPTVNITGVEVREIKRVSENGRFRSYVLVALPTGDANALQRRQDQLQLRQQAQQRGDQAFREMDAAKPQ